MEQKVNINELLEWYLQSGVDETCGETPGLKNKSSVQVNALTGVKVAPEMPNQAANTFTATNVKVATVANTRNVLDDSFARPAMTSLAQANTTACRNAREICEKAISLEELRHMVENFEGCALKFNAKSTVFGDGSPNAQIVIIGEAPGADEDRLGKPFVGRSGRLLEKMLRAIGLSREDVYITNVLPWRPPGNRTPTDGEVAVCLPFLKRQIDFIRPKIILLLGGSAANALLDNGEPISRLRGRWLEYTTSDKSTVAALASFHPAFLLRNGAQKAKAWSDFLRMIKKLKEN